MDRLGVGFLVGAGVRYGAHLGGEDESFAQGTVAALLAISSILAAKYFVFELVVANVDTADIREMIDDESLIVGIADEIVREEMDRGQPVIWPAGMSIETARGRDDYPPAIWQTAEARWNGLAPDEREQRREEMAETFAEVFRTIARPDFAETFSPWDLLWFGLATFTAFKIGTGSYGGD